MSKTLRFWEGCPDALMLRGGVPDGGGVSVNLLRTVRALVLTAIACFAAAPVAEAATQFRISGRGWGHGIGLSQYGAEGFARRGYTAQQIVTHYYQGTTVGTSPVGLPDMNVLLRGGGQHYRFEIDADGATATYGSASFPLAVDDVISVQASGGNTTLRLTRGGSVQTLGSGQAATVTLTQTSAGAIRTLFTADNGSYGHHYRGSIAVKPSGSSLLVVNTVPLESYLRSVVPAEMPASWSPAALQAQSIAARSYAIATRKSGSAYDAFADTRSQMYVGIEHEDPRTDAALTATAGQVAVHSGKVIAAFFYSTSGGRTAAVEDVWNSTARPYLSSVSDPYEVSPYSKWKPLVYSAAQLDAKLGSAVRGRLTNITTSINGSLRVRSVTVRGTGGPSSLLGTSFQYRLGLRSSWFRVARLTLNPTARTTSSGSRVLLRGFVPRSGPTQLWVKPAGGVWKLRGNLKPGARGAYSVAARPRVTSMYALKRGGIWGPRVSVRVS